MTECNECSRFRANAIKKQRLQYEDQKLPDNRRDVQRMINELQIHQIELEMQNEELIRTRNLAEYATKKYAHLYDFAPIAYLTLDRAGIIQELNLKASYLLGRERSKLINKELCVFFSGKSRQRFRDFLDRLFSGDKDMSEEMNFPNISENLHLYMEGSCIEEEGLCLICIIDITEKKRAQENLLRQMKLQRTIMNISCRCISAVNNNMKEIVNYILDTIGKHINAEKGFYYRFSKNIFTRLNEWHRSIDIPSETDDLMPEFLVLLKDQEYCLIKDHSLKSGNNSDIIRQIRSYKIRSFLSIKIADLGIMTFESSLWNLGLYNEDMMLIKLLSNIVFDTYIRIENNKKIVNAMDKAEKANKAKSDFLAHMNHEIRTPLNGIIGFIDQLKTTSLNEDQKECIHYAETSARNLHKIIHDILDFSKIESGIIELEMIETDIKPLIHEILAVYKHMIMEKNVDVNLNIDGFVKSKSKLCSPLKSII